LCDRVKKFYSARMCECCSRPPQRPEKDVSRCAADSGMAGCCFISGRAWERRAPAVSGRSLKGEDWLGIAPMVGPPRDTATAQEVTRYLSRHRSDG